MSDEKFDNWLTEAAHKYNVPPREVPREEMWIAIAAALEDPGRGTQDSRRALLARPSPVASRSWLAAAAVALVAAGLAGGYWLRGADTPVTPKVAAVDTSSRANGSLNQALVQHFTDAEALLVAFRGGPEIAGGDATSLNRWARDVLGTTRLLLDSSVGSTPSQRSLLEDLELILVQIANLSSRTPADEREMTRESLTREQLLTRLRSTVPAGMVSGT